jgi:uncharacterized paraquat-inducible protein A
VFKIKKWGISMKYLTNTLIIIVLSSLFFPQKAFAYLDPGSTSFIIQIVLAIIAGGIFGVKLFWKNIKTFLKNVFSKN